MSYKNILVSCFFISSILVPNFFPAQASSVPVVTQTSQEKIILLKQLLEKVKTVQLQLEKLIREESLKNSAISLADYTKGNVNARVQILTFTDLECPFCQIFHETLDVVLKDNPSISVTYRNYPLEEIHPNARELAIASECAGQIGGDKAFFSLVDSIFNSSRVSGGTNMALLPSFVKKAGVSETAFNNCLSSQISSDAVEADLEDGLAFGVQGTPMSFIFKDGKLVSQINGAQSAESIQELISNLLK